MNGRLNTSTVYAFHFSYIKSLSHNILSVTSDLAKDLRINIIGLPTELLRLPKKFLNEIQSEQ